MSTLIKLKRGTKTAVKNTTLDVGEPAVSLDTGELYVGLEGGKKHNITMYQSILPSERDIVRNTVSDISYVENCVIGIYDRTGTSRHIDFFVRNDLSYPWYDETNNKYMIYMYDFNLKFLDVARFNINFVNSSSYNKIEFPDPPSTEDFPVRQDLVFLEIWHEDVSEKGVVYPYGNVQYSGNSYSSQNISFTLITPTFAGADTYSLFGPWQTPGSVIGKAIDWNSLSEDQKIAFMRDFRNNMYISSDNKVIQIRYRIRVHPAPKPDIDYIQMFKLRYSNPYLFRMMTIDYWGDDAEYLPTVQGKLVAPKPFQYANGLFYSLGRGLVMNPNVASLYVNHTDASDGPADYLDGSYRFSDNPYLCAIPLFVFINKNQGAYHPVYNKYGTRFAIDSSGNWTDWSLSDLSYNSFADCMTNRASKFYLFPYNVGYNRDVYTVPIRLGSNIAVFYAFYTNYYHISTDGGNTFTYRSPTESGLSSKPHVGMFYDYTNNKLYIGCDGKYIYVSTDDGLTFTQATQIVDAATSFRSIHRATGGTRLFVGTDNGVSAYVSYSDDETTWTTVQIPNAQRIHTVYAVSDTIVLASTWSGSTIGTWRSTDGGATWTYITSTHFSFFFKENTILKGVDTKGNIYESTDDGATWVLKFDSSQKVRSSYQVWRSHATSEYERFLSNWTHYPVSFSQGYVLKVKKDYTDYEIIRCVTGDTSSIYTMGNCCVIDSSTLFYYRLEPVKVALDSGIAISYFSTQKSAVSTHVYQPVVPLFYLIHTQVRTPLYYLLGISSTSYLAYSKNDSICGYGYDRVTLDRYGGYRFDYSGSVITKVYIPVNSLEQQLYYSDNVKSVKIGNFGPYDASISESKTYMPNYISFSITNGPSVNDINSMFGYVYDTGSALICHNPNITEHVLKFYDVNGEEIVPWFTDKSTGSYDIGFANVVISNIEPNNYKFDSSVAVSAGDTLFYGNIVKVGTNYYAFLGGVSSTDSSAETFSGVDHPLWNADGTWKNTFTNTAWWKDVTNQGGYPAEWRQKGVDGHPAYILDDEAQIKIINLKDLPVFTVTDGTKIKRIKPVPIDLPGTFVQCRPQAWINNKRVSICIISDSTTNVSDEFLLNTNFKIFASITDYRFRYSSTGCIYIDYDGLDDNATMIISYRAFSRSGIPSVFKDTSPSTIGYSPQMIYTSSYMGAERHLPFFVGTGYYGSTGYGVRVVSGESYTLHGYDSLYYYGRNNVYLPDLYNLEDFVYHGYDVKAIIASMMRYPHNRELYISIYWSDIYRGFNRSNLGYYGDTNSIYSSFRCSNGLYLTIEERGMFYSDDNFGHRMPCNITNDDVYSYSISRPIGKAFAELSGVYYAVFVRNTATATESILLRSHNGINWEIIHRTTTEIYRGVVTNVSLNQVLFYGDNVVYVSNDGGTTWNTNTTNVPIIYDVTYGPNNTAYAVNNIGIAKCSTQTVYDGTWTYLTIPFGSFCSYRINLRNSDGFLYLYDTQNAALFYVDTTTDTVNLVRQLPIPRGDSVYYLERIFDGLWFIITLSDQIFVLMNPQTDEPLALYLANYDQRYSNHNIYCTVVSPSGTGAYLCANTGVVFEYQRSTNNIFIISQYTKYSTRMFVPNYNVSYHRFASTDSNKKFLCGYSVVPIGVVLDTSTSTTV